MIDIFKSSFAETCSIDFTYNKMSTPNTPIYDTTSEMPCGNVMIMRDGVVTSSLQFVCLSIVSALFGIIAQLRAQLLLSNAFVAVSAVSVMIVLVTIALPEVIKDISWASISRKMNGVALNVSVMFGILTIVFILYRT